VKLQDSYAVEANALGTWKNIGYTAPGATATGTSGSTTTFKYEPQNGGKDWKATSLAALNDCKLGSSWAVDAFRDSNTGIVTYKATVVANGATGNTDCTTLTPNFGKLSSDQVAH